MHKFSKRTLAVVVPTAALSIVGVAFAANLGVVSNYLGGGSAPVDNLCSIHTSYATSGATPANVQWFNEVPAVTTPTPAAAIPAGYYLTSVTVVATGAQCADSTFRLSVTNLAGEQISEYDGTLASGSQSVVLNKRVLAEKVTGVSAVVTKLRSA